MITTNRSIWMRLGVSVFGNAEEIDKILNGDQPQLIKLLRESKFKIYGDTYIPDASVDDYNQANGTHYAEQEVEFDLNFKPAEHNNTTIVDAKSAGYLSKNETIVRICPDTKLPVLVCHEGEGCCLCLHNDSAEEDRQAINNWLSANVETIKSKTCPECQEEALRYAVIDVDGTNLEEGYSCRECGANFIGLDNHEVTELNPQITEDNE